VETCISAPPLHSHFTAHPSLPTSVRTCIFFVVERDLRPSPCADLTECQSDAVHRGLLCFTLSSMSVTARFLAFLLASTCSRFARRLQVGVAMSRLYTTADAFSLFLTFRATLSSRAPGNSFKPRHCRRSASSSRSIDRNRSTSLVQRRFTQTVGDSLLFSDGENMHFRSTASTAHHFNAHPALPTSVRTCIFFVVERDLRPSPCADLTERQ
jgi:hypothetical protein